ncbi:MAG TPA: PfkB family carbohydrate kinase [Gemmataceae bacterium]|jgi:bifunctional ADP-heptose synthase (sugar kinase/adenylyltransferase)
MADLRPLDGDTLEAILERIPRLTIGVVGDLFLDRYLDLDAALTEPSLETGLDAYQVVGVRSYPGAAGTVLNNLVALGVGRVCPISLIGSDGEGYELRRALKRMPAVDLRGLIVTSKRRTPTYTKPMLHSAGVPRELNRLDIKNRRRMPEGLDGWVAHLLGEFWPQFDGLVVLDQVSESDCGVVTGLIRLLLTDLTAKEPGKFVLADSRDRIGLFRGVSLKPNRQEALRAVGLPLDDSEESLQQGAGQLARQAGCWVFCTDGARGIYLASPQVGDYTKLTRIPTYPVSGPIDIVGAGDSTSAGIVCAMASGATVEAAAAFGNLVASITIQQIGTTGTATPDQVRQRWRETN